MICTAANVQKDLAQEFNLVHQHRISAVNYYKPNERTLRFDLTCSTFSFIQLLIKEAFAGMKTN